MHSEEFIPECYIRKAIKTRDKNVSVVKMGKQLRKLHWYGYVDKNKEGEYRIKKKYLKTDFS